MSTISILCGILIQLFRGDHAPPHFHAWPGEIDLAPDAMHDAIKQKGRWVLQ